MDKLNSRIIIEKQSFNEIEEITQNLFNIVGYKRIQNLAPEILDVIGKLSDIVHTEKKTENETIIYEFPFEIGTYLDRNNCLSDHIDQLKAYVVKQDGVYAILILDVLCENKKESEVSLEKLLSEWTAASEKQVEHEEGIQRLLKK